MDWTPPAGMVVREDWTCFAGTRRCPGRRNSMKKSDAGWVCACCERPGPSPKKS
jgi:hypothetical protein